MKAKTRHWFIYQQPCFRFHIFAIHLIGVRIMPLAGRDESSVAMIEVGVVYFNPRAPRGARRSSVMGSPLGSAFQSTRPARGATERPVWLSAPQRSFQSTRPARGATKALRSLFDEVCISIHAPREGRDDVFHHIEPIDYHFNPRAPRGARHHRILFWHSIPEISIHAPREGRDA